MDKRWVEGQEAGFSGTPEIEVSCVSPAQKYDGWLQSCLYFTKFPESASRAVLGGTRYPLYFKNGVFLRDFQWGLPAPPPLLVVPIAVPVPVPVRIYSDGDGDGDGDAVGDASEWATKKENGGRPNFFRAYNTKVEECGTKASFGLDFESNLPPRGAPDLPRNWAQGQGLRSDDPPGAPGGRAGPAGSCGAARVSQTARNGPRARENPPPSNETSNTMSTGMSTYRSTSR